MSCKVKIHGASVQDLAIAERAGADAFAVSCEQQSSASIRELFATTKLDKCLVINQSRTASALLLAAESLGADALQLAYCPDPKEATELWFKRRELKIIQTLEVNPEIIEDARQASLTSHAIILYCPNSDALQTAVGAAKELRSFGHEVGLSGAIRPGNLRQVLSLVSPDFVDASGVENDLGQLSEAACQDFVSIAQSMLDIDF